MPICFTVFGAKIVIAGCHRHAFEIEWSAQLAFSTEVSISIKTDHDALRTPELLERPI